MGAATCAWMSCAQMELGTRPGSRKSFAEGSQLRGYLGVPPEYQRVGTGLGDGGSHHFSIDANSVYNLQDTGAAHQSRDDSWRLLLAAQGKPAFGFHSPGGTSPPNQTLPLGRLFADRVTSKLTRAKWQHPREAAKHAQLCLSAARSPERNSPSKPSAGPTPKTNMRAEENGNRMCVSLRGRGARGQQKDLAGTRAGQVQGRTSDRSTEHPTCTLTHTCSTPRGRRQGPLTCGLVALEVDDAHPLKARAALLASKVDQGEVPVGIPAFVRTRTHSRVW